jgi:hypothetical protein
MLFEAVICSSWNGNGSDFGYRYLIGTFVGALVVARELAGKPKAGTRLLFERIGLLCAAWLTYLTLVYKTTVPLGGGFVPHFLWHAIRAPLDPEVYGASLSLSPLGALCLSFIGVHPSPSAPYVVEGLASGFLVVATGACLAFMIAYLMRHWTAPAVREKL